MPRSGSSPLSFPAFRGATRALVVGNLAAFFVLLVLSYAATPLAAALTGSLSLDPHMFLHGALWQPLTYSFIHLSITGTLFELISLWFMAGFLEQMNSPGWVMGLYATSVLGTAAAALLIYAFSSGAPISLSGCFGGIFGMLIAIGVLYGDMEFLLFFTIGIKARYLAVIYGLISIAMLFTAQRIYAFAELGGALAAVAFVRFTPRRGVSFLLSEQWYGLRNRYYRWKRRKAAKKFEVYMRKQGRTVHLDGTGRQIDKDDDRSRWN